MNMQVFYKHLAAVKAPSAHQRSLARLTRVNRAQILKATHESQWLIWEATEATSAQ
jgi:hypothetical protein